MSRPISPADFPARLYASAGWFPYHPLTPPETSPLWIYFCKHIKTIIMGIDDRTAAAENVVQCAANWSLINVWSPSARVILPGVCKKIDVITYSLYVAIQENRKITASCGAANGRMIFRNT